MCLSSIVEKSDTFLNNFYPGPFDSYDTNKKIKKLKYFARTDRRIIIFLKVTQYWG